MLIRRAPDAQLAVGVVAPALDFAARHERARVVRAQGDGGGGDACVCGERKWCWWWWGEGGGFAWLSRQKNSYSEDLEFEPRKGLQQPSSCTQTPRANYP